MPGYFKVPLSAACALLNRCDGPELLAGYIALRCYAFGRNRDLTAAGAKAIRRVVGCTDWRSKRVLDALRGLRVDSGNDLCFVEKTDMRKANAMVYRLPPWPGRDAYLPALRPNDETMLRAIYSSSLPPLVQRDALHLLLYLYSRIEYGAALGALPDVFAHELWDRDGAREIGNGCFPLGSCGSLAGMGLWRVSPRPLEGGWSIPRGLAEEIFGDCRLASQHRFWRALQGLLDLGLVCKVAVVQDGPLTYPLWVFNPAYRRSLDELGIDAGLARAFQERAWRAGDEEAAQLYVTSNSDDCARDGTGIFYCVGSNPEVFTLLTPRVHAPTPQNLDGLTEAAKITEELIARISDR